jgi:hypothetical protein
VTTTAPTKPLEVALPVCPVAGCRHIGKLPAGAWSGKGWCSGPDGEQHRKVRMETRTFVEAGE